MIPDELSASFRCYRLWYALTSLRRPGHDFLIHFSSRDRKATYHTYWSRNAQLISTIIASFAELFLEQRIIAELGGRKLLVCHLYIIHERGWCETTTIIKGTREPLWFDGRNLRRTVNDCDVHIPCDCSNKLQRVSATVVDLCITMLTSFSTKSILNYLLLFAINRGVFVALNQLAFFATFIAAPTKSYWWAT